MNARFKWFFIQRNNWLKFFTLPFFTCTAVYCSAKQLNWNVYKLDFVMLKFSAKYNENINIRIAIACSRFWFCTHFVTITFLLEFIIWLVKFDVKLNVFLSVIFWCFCLSSIYEINMYHKSHSRKYTTAVVLCYIYLYLDYTFFSFCFDFDRQLKL